MILIIFWNFLENIRNEAQETKMFFTDSDVISWEQGGNHGDYSCDGRIGQSAISVCYV